MAFLTHTYVQNSATDCCIYLNVVSWTISLFCSRRAIIREKTELRQARVLLLLLRPACRMCPRCCSNNSIGAHLSFLFVAHSTHRTFLRAAVDASTSGKSLRFKIFSVFTTQSVIETTTKTYFDQNLNIRFCCYQPNRFYRLRYER